MIVVGFLKKGAAWLLCFAFLALSACEMPNVDLTSSESTDGTVQSDVKTESGDTVSSELVEDSDTDDSSEAVSREESTEKASSTKNSVSSKKTSSKVTVGTTSKNTTSKVTVIAPKPEEETVEKPEALPEAKPVEKPEEIKPVITDLTPIKTQDFYGRAQLSKKKNAASLLAAYDRIVAGVEKTEESINLKDPDHPISVDEFFEVILYYMNDYPHHFWLGKNIGYSRDRETGVVYSYTPEYVIEPGKLDKAKKDWNTAVKELLKGISGSASEYEREKMIHDRLAAKVTYTFSDNAHTAYGALVEGKAVCEGYARAFQYLCYQSGIQCLIVSGTSTNPSNDKPESHAWNMAKIDGDYYHVDVTWDDQEETLFYAYFNLNDKMIEDEHTIGKDNYDLPKCSATTANYFMKNKCALDDDYTVKQVAALMKAGNGTAHILVDDVKDFWEWFKENRKEICKELGLKGKFKYGYSTLGNEVIPWMRASS